MSMMNMMADGENRRREHGQAIRSADDSCSAPCSIVPERSAAIFTFDITRQREWLMARIGSGGMEGIALMFMGSGSGEGWKVDLEHWPPRTTGPRRSSRLPHRT